VETFRAKITATVTRKELLMAKISFKPIVPKGKVIDEQEVLKAIKQTLVNVTGKKLQTDFKKTVATWDNRPTFAKKFIQSPNQMIEQVYPTGANKDQYYYVHEGTKARLILPRPGNRVLKFKPGYLPATKPGNVGSKHAFRFGATVFATQVRNHPGIRPRKFSEAIAKKNQRPFEVDIQEAINRVVD